MVHVESVIDANLHVQPSVAVDQVVAATAFDDVAAATSEDNVAGAERGYRGHTVADHIVEEALQSVDQGDIGEHAAGKAGGGDRNRIRIIAAQDVAELRSRHAFRRFEAGED